MDAHGSAFGLANNYGVELPAICVGHPLRDDFTSCPNEGSVLLTTLIVGEDGGPRPVLLTVCPQHVRPAVHWLESQGIGDQIDRWATRTFFEHAEIVERSGVQFERLERLSA